MTSTSRHCRRTPPCNLTIPPSRRSRVHGPGRHPAGPTWISVQLELSISACGGVFRSFLHPTLSPALSFLKMFTGLVEEIGGQSAQVALEMPPPD